MSFRTKLFLVFTLTVVAAVGLVAWGVSRYTSRVFEQLDQRHTEALLEQFRHEFTQRGQEVVNRVQGIANAEATVRMAIDLSRPQADPSVYVNDAVGVASSHQLDFLDFVSNEGKVISSAQWPARFGYSNDWIQKIADWNSRGAFLRRVELPDGVALSLAAVRVVRVGERNLYIVGGQRLDQGFLASLALPAGMRALLYRNLEPGFSGSELTAATGAISQPDRLAPFINQVIQKKSPAEETISWSSDPLSAETFHAIPLIGREDDLLGVLLLGSSRRDLVRLTMLIRALGMVVAGAGIALGVILSWWVAARITRPVERLAAGVREVAGGNWGARVDVRSRDEIGLLARAFNDMTQQLAEQRQRLVQAERVAAWRELARRLAHELKNPLFPLQITVENLQRAREQTSEQFDEIFFESTAALRAELENMKKIIGRFSDFAKMPAPQLQEVSVNEILRAAVKLHEPQFSILGRPPVVPELYLDEKVPAIQADPDLLHRALSNLVLNSLDAMPSGGTLTVRTFPRNGGVRLEVSDTGTGLTAEECARLFTPYYTTKQHGTGLGLAIVQSVISDHGGKITVESTPGTGTTFRIELPARPPRENETRPESSGPVGEMKPGRKDAAQKGSSA